MGVVAIKTIAIAGRKTARTRVCAPCGLKTRREYLFAAQHIASPHRWGFAVAGAYAMGQCLTLTALSVLPVAGAYAMGQGYLRKFRRCKALAGACAMGHLMWYQVPHCFGARRRVRDGAQSLHYRQAHDYARRRVRDGAPCRWAPLAATVPPAHAGQHRQPDSGKALNLPA